MDRKPGWIPLLCDWKGMHDWCLGTEAEANSRGHLKQTVTAHFGGGLMGFEQRRSSVRVSFNLLAGSRLRHLLEGGKEGAMMFPV